MSMGIPFLVATGSSLAWEPFHCLCCELERPLLGDTMPALVAHNTGERMMAFVAQAREDERAWSRYVTEPSWWE